MNKQASNTYMIPFSHLDGTLAEMLFADAIYFLLATRGETNRKGHRFVETTIIELQTLTSLTRKTIRKQMDRLLQLDAPFQFVEEDGITPNSRLLKQCYYQKLNQERCIQKPQSFMRNHWGWVLAQPLPGQNKSSRFPYAILNILVRKPNGRLTSLKELQKRIQKRGARKLPSLMHVQKAIAFLQDLNLIAKDGEGFRLNKAQFAQNGRSQYEKLAKPSSNKQETQLWQWATKETPKRAKLAQEIATLGQFDARTFGKEIFYDLAQIQQDTDLDWLKYAVQRHRHRPQTKDRWQRCWQLFQNRLTQQKYGARSPKVHLKFSHQTKHTIQLTLPNHQPAELRWGKLVIWVEDSRFIATGMGRQETIQVKLGWQYDNFFWKRKISYEDSLIRLDLTAVLKQTSTPLFEFHASTQKPLRQFSLDILLESEYIKPPEK
ncbi:MAG: hypothetical protein DHS20C20_03930 [Ardenticatenaceae bacterium]|nr:MAG: hypothetical protein DHS20C20_03930 [Ardenticatenaceae bacterium]